MPPFLALGAFLAPVLLVAASLVALAQPGARPSLVLRASRLATLGAFAVALASAAALALEGAATSPLLGAAGIGFSVRLDALSAVMFLLVSFIGAVVVQFSRNYLDGDARHGAFLGGICLTLAAVLLLVLAGNLFQLVAAWIATSLALHRLLLFYPERPAARLAARKKFLTARAGDACLIAAALLLVQAFGTGDIATMLQRAQDLGRAQVPAAVPAAALLVAVAALLKSAQFPTHGWLIEVMETPTPVSALLHAGIINAGGFLVLRFADVMLLGGLALHVLAIVGGFTALFAGIVMLTQTSVKVSLAWSTVAQMGFMLLQCGLGAFHLAVLHIVAHSLYKAHAFLASGSVIDIARTAAAPATRRPAHAGHLLASLVLALALYASLGWGFGLFAGKPAAVLALGSIFVMGLSHLISQSLQGGAEGSAVGRTLAAAGGATLAYFMLQTAAARLLSATLPAPAPLDTADIAIMTLAIASFALVTVLQILMPSRSGRAAWQSARVHVANGFYANAVFNRLSGGGRRPAVNHPSRSLP